MSHTFVTLPVPQEMFDLVQEKLRAAGYDHAFVDGVPRVIDMHGLALVAEVTVPERAEPPGITPIAPPAAVKEIAEAGGGKIEECARLPDGSGFATVSFPLPEDHWIYGKDDKVHPVHGFTLHPPPMRFRMGEADVAAVTITVALGGPSNHKVRSAAFMRRLDFAEVIREAGKYAVRAATMDGKETDFDPDALLQNLVIAFLGYWTEDGLSSDLWSNPPPFDGLSDALPSTPPAVESLTRAGDDSPPVTDRQRMEWCLPLLTGSDDAAADERTRRLGAALIRGLSGRAAIDHAMGIAP